ncbi:MAG: NAD(P)H-flavin reductase, partial [Thiotrichales bacterium]
EYCEDWQGRTGLVHQAVLQDFTNLHDYYTYLAGPFAMALAARRDFSTRDMSFNHMFADAFAFSV